MTALIERYRIVRRLVAAELARPYVIGSADCFMMGCRLADALDPELGPPLGLEARYAGSYSTLAGAQRALRRRGCTSLVDLFDRDLTRCAPAQARLGDLAIVLAPDDGLAAEHVAVCMGARFTAKTHSGARDFRAGDCLAAFRTGGR